MEPHKSGAGRRTSAPSNTFPTPTRTLPTRGSWRRLGRDPQAASVVVEQLEKRRVTTFAKNLLGGGAERVAVNLLQGLPRERFSQELVLVEAWGPFLDQVPEDVPLTDLGLGKGVSSAIVPLARYLKQHQPDVLISHLAHANVAAVLAVNLAQVATKVVLIEHNNLSILETRQLETRQRSLPSKLLQKFKAQVYRRADVVIGVSEGVANYVQSSFGVSDANLRTIYNPVVNDELITKSRLPLTHPWFGKGAPPVFLAVGRLGEEKDFSTLIRAFAVARQQRPCKLMILGQGSLRGELEAEIRALGLAGDVAMQGFVDNPYAYMKGAATLVLSSKREGLPTVLIEAMACGCPVVATDCPSGPNEILEGGRWGPLVEVGNPSALANAMLATLERPLPAEALKKRASAFSFDRAIASYTNFLGAL